MKPTGAHLPGACLANYDRTQPLLLLAAYTSSIVRIFGAYDLITPFGLDATYDRIWSAQGISDGETANTFSFLWITFGGAPGNGSIKKLPFLHSRQIL